jgi:hypothetical protein
VRIEIAVALIVTFAAVTPAATASTLLIVSATGTYDPLTPSSFFTAPNGTWSLSFVTESNPPLSNASPGVFFSPVFSSFAYSLNGASLAIAPDDISFWNVPGNQPFILSLSVCWNSLCAGGTRDGIAFDTNQLYTGSEPSPTIVPGVYDTSEFFVVVHDSSYTEPNTTLTVTATPEPPVRWLIAVGVFALAAVRFAFAPVSK